jgi:uncharacterized phosphosugar-binding protein
VQYTAESYLDHALQVSSRAAATQLDRVREAADLISTALGEGRRWWVFGTGHSHMIAEEVYGRAGGLTDVKAILEPALMLHEGLLKSSLLERRSGLAEDLLDVHPVQSGDVVMIISNSGRNAVPVEFATGCRQRGAKVIALTSLEHSRAVASRAPSGHKLFEVADVVIDNCGTVGDAAIDGEVGAVGPTSTVVGALLVQAVVVETVGRMLGAGRSVRILNSLNA